MKNAILWTISKKNASVKCSRVKLVRMNIYKTTEDIKNHRRIGIIGGAFNPIHYGHLAAAEGARCELGLDAVLFMPTSQAPHKAIETFKEHRYIMTLLACAENDYFYTSRMEFERSGPSYTVDTLRTLQKESKAELYFIVGADEMMQITKWKEPAALMRLCSWAVLTRPGYDTSTLREHIAYLKENYGCQAALIEMPGFDISSTVLRERSKAGKSIKYMVPSAIERFIHEMKLYEASTAGFYDKIYAAVADKLSEKRIQHTLGVIDVSLLLAALHGANFHKTYLAALLHDYAKEYNEEESRALCRKFAIHLDKYQAENISLMHGHLSAELARQEFDIKDAEILNAIKYHTTGRAGMGLIEKIIKIADNSEANRPDFPGKDIIKSLSLENAGKAAAASIRRDHIYTRERGRAIHPWGMEALHSLEGE